MANWKKVYSGLVSLILVSITCISGCSTGLEPAKETKKPVTIDKTSQLAPQKQEPQTEKTNPEIDWTEPELAGSVSDIVAWRYKFNDIDAYQINNGKVFISSNYGSKIFCLDIKTGQIIWCTKGSSYSSNMCCQDSELIMFGDPIESYDINTGYRKWSMKRTPYEATIASLTKKRFFVVTYDHSIHCIDTDTGNLNWKTENIDEHSNCTGIFSTDDFVFFAVGGKLICLDANTGNQLWKCDTAGDASMPSIYNGKVYFGTCLINQSENEEGKYWFYCYDLKTGDKDWSIKLDSGIYGAPLIVGGCAYAEGIKYSCFDLSQKRLVWQWEIENYEYKPPVYSDGNLYLFIDKSWSQVDKRSGKVLQKLNLNGDFDFKEHRSIAIVGPDRMKSIQCKVGYSFITDDMFIQNSNSPLQRIFKSSTMFISLKNTGKTGIICHTWDKIFWETPDDWSLVDTNYTGNKETFFGLFGNKVIIAKETKGKQYFVCLEKETGKQLWEVDKGKNKIDSLDNGILTLYSIENLKRVDINDGVVKDIETPSYDKMVLFETKLPGDSWVDRPSHIQEFTEGYYLCIAQGASKGEPVGNRYSLDANGKFTLLFKEGSVYLSYIKRLHSKFYVCTITNTYDPSSVILTEVDAATGQSKNIGEDYVPRDAVLINSNALYNNPQTYDLSSDMIKKIGVQPHKSSDYFDSHMKGINIGNYTFCIRENGEGFEYTAPYYDFMGVYDAKTMKKLWSYEKKIYQYVFTETTIVLYSPEDKAGVMFNDIKTGKTMLKYDKAVLINKVGDICFLINEGKMVAINMKKLGN